ncbi:MAG: ferric reductase-like transmembrane domain-containing protein [Patescibacteria group bacterium]|nr:ferric reductase-like transmembrane domain-containing protein [Patescibacteria group bacterium]
MDIIKAYREWRDMKGITHEDAMWFQAIVFAVYIYILTALYIGGIRGLLLPQFVEIALGYTSLVLLLCAMGMSSICYFWDFADRYMGYRKHFGVLAWLYASMHFGLMLVHAEYRVGLETYVSDPRTAGPLYASLTTLLILTFMTVISHRLAIRNLGEEMWRVLLRLGYLALMFAMARIAMTDGVSWWAWLTGDSEALLPPLGLLLFTGGLVVLTLRTAMEIHRRIHGKEIPAVPIPSSVHHHRLPHAVAHAAPHSGMHSVSRQRTSGHKKSPAKLSSRG